MVYGNGRYAKPGLLIAKSRVYRGKGNSGTQFTVCSHTEILSEQFLSGCFGQENGIVHVGKIPVGEIDQRKKSGAMVSMHVGKKDSLEVGKRNVLAQ